MRALLFALIAGAAGLVPGGCGPASVQVSATAYSPRLVMVSPGIWIVEDYPYAIYYSDGFYWRYSSGVWYRSSYYDGGFARVDIGIVPRVVVRSYHPSHVRYRPPAHVQRRVIVRDHRSRPHRR